MLDITPLAGALGAEIRGIDLSQALNDDTVRKLRKLLNEYQVIFFREQAISPQQQTDLAQCLAHCSNTPPTTRLRVIPQSPYWNPALKSPVK